MTKVICPPHQVICAKCGTEFTSTHSQGKYCSPPCARLGERVSWKKYGEKNRAKRHLYSLEHYDKNREAILERTKAYHATEKGMEARANLVKGQRSKMTAERKSLRNTVRLAMLKGTLTKKPCEQCGAEPAEAHHDDYSKPLDVRWLCKRHHGEHHRAIKREATRAALDAH